MQRNLCLKMYLSKVTRPLSWCRSQRDHSPKLGSWQIWKTLISLKRASMTKNTKKLMPKNTPVQNYKVLKLVMLLDSLTTSNLLYYYLHHHSILIQNGKYRQETFLSNCLPRIEFYICIFKERHLTFSVLQTLFTKTHWYNLIIRLRKQSNDC